MSWEAINTIAQLISSIGVIASLWYLALQVHRSTRVSRIAAQDSAATALREVTQPLMENAELGRVWEVGLEDLSALSSTEQTRFFHAAYQFLKAFETIYTHYTARVLDRQLWEGWRELLRHYVFAPGMAHYWKMRSYLFSSRFQEFIQNLEPPSEHLTIGKLVVETKTTSELRPAPPAMNH